MFEFRIQFWTQDDLHQPEKIHLFFTLHKWYFVVALAGQFGKKEHQDINLQ